MFASRLKQEGRGWPGEGHVLHGGVGGPVVHDHWLGGGQSVSL